MAHLHLRILGTLSFTVLRCRGLKNVARFGQMHPQVSVTVNGHKKYTRTLENGGCDVEFNETLVYRLDCQPTDLVQIKAKHDSDIRDSTIGVFSISIGDLLKHNGKNLKVELVDPSSFKPRGSIELITRYEGPQPLPSPTSPPHALFRMSPDALQAQQLAMAHGPISPMASPMAMHQQPHHTRFGSQELPYGMITTPVPVPMPMPIHMPPQALPSPGHVQSPPSLAGPSIPPPSLTHPSIQAPATAVPPPGAALVAPPAASDHPSASSSASSSAAAASVYTPKPPLRWSVIRYGVGLDSSSNSDGAGLPVSGSGGSDGRPAPLTRQRSLSGGVQGECDAGSGLVRDLSLSDMIRAFGRSVARDLNMTARGVDALQTELDEANRALEEARQRAAERERAYEDLLKTMANCRCGLTAPAPHAHGHGTAATAAAVAATQATPSSSSSSSGSGSDSPSASTFARSRSEGEPISTPGPAPALTVATGAEL